MEKLSIGKNGWTIDIYLIKQKECKKFDESKEIDLVKKCHENILQIFSNPDKFAKKLAKMENIPIENPETKKLHSNIVFTTDKDCYCVGSGGVGGGKVFWTPYTAEDKKIIDDDLCDNCKTLTHELQHGIGSQAEFDTFSTIPSLLFRINNFKKGERLEHSIENLFISTAIGNEKAKNVFCSINEHKPNELKQILKEKGFKEDMINKVIKKSCKV